jgi:hypothetical protein
MLHSFIEQSSLSPANFVGYTWEKNPQTKISFHAHYIEKNPWFIHIP